MVQRQYAPITAAFCRFARNCAGARDFETNFYDGAITVTWTTRPCDTIFIKMKSTHFNNAHPKPIRFLKPYRFVSSIIFLLFFTACNNQEGMKEAFIQEEVKTNIEKYKVKKRMECISAALDSANRITDSIILMKMSAIDTNLLRRPAKPIKPIIKSPLDTTPVQPILQK
jgi:hypothetical protein